MRQWRLSVRAGRTYSLVLMGQNCLRPLRLKSRYDVLKFVLLLKLFDLRYCHFDGVIVTVSVFDIICDIKKKCVGKKDTK